MALQTNTPRTFRNTHETQTQEKEPSVINRLTTLVNHVARSDEYRTLRANRVPHTEAYTSAVETILNSSDIGFNSLDSALLFTSSRLGTFMEAQEELATLEDQRTDFGRLSQGDFDRTKELKREYVIPFNHVLKSLINEIPNTSLNDLASGLTRTYTAVFSRYNSLHPENAKRPEDIIKPSEVMYRLKQTANGMRHEVAAETMLTAAGLEYDYDISVEEDARGIDIVVYLDGKREPIDIKASRLGAERAHDKHGDSRAVWTQLGREDFRGMKGTADDALSIPFDTALYHADSFVDSIRAAINSSNVHKEQVARRLARSVRL